MNKDVYNEIVKGSVEKLRKDNSFIRRNWTVLILAWIGWAIGTIVSAFSIFSHITIRAGQTFIPAIAITLAVLGTVSIIVFQFMLKYFVDDVQAKAWFKGGSDRGMMLAKLVAGLLGLVFGALLSINGAAKAVDYVRKENTEENLPLVSQEEIRRGFDARRAALQHQRETYEASTWKGKPTPQSLRGVRQIDAQINQLDNEMRVELFKADSLNTSMLTEYRAETQVNSNAARGFMWINELLIIPLCLLLIGLYDDGVKKEAKSLGIDNEVTFPAGRG